MTEKASDNGGYQEPYRDTIDNKPSWNAKRVEYPDSLPGSEREHPWRDEELLRELYLDEGYSTEQMASGWDCGTTTIINWMDRYGIERRSWREAGKHSWGAPPGCPLRTMKRGHEAWQASDRSFAVHRLLAVAEFGVDAVKGVHVHHKNGIKWDNRPDNLELVTNSEHQRRHMKVSGIDRLRIAEFYNNGDISSRDLADYVDYDITMSTVLLIRDEFAGGDSDT